MVYLKRKWRQSSHMSHSMWDGQKRGRFSNWRKKYMANDRISIDISLCDGWFAILYGGQEESLIYQNRMIIGHLEDDALEKITHLPKRVCFKIKWEETK